MSAKIVSLADLLDARRSRVLDQAMAYWDGLRNGRAAPSRAELDPRGLPGILPHCFILQRIAPGMGRFRICGRHLTDLMGVEMVGLPVSTILDPDSRDSFEHTLEDVFSRPATARLTVEIPGGFARPPVSGQMALMPLRDDLGATSRVLGCVHFEGQIRPAPRKLIIRDTKLFEIPRGRPVTTRPLDPASPDRPLPDGPAQVIPLEFGAD